MQYLCLFYGSDNNQYRNYCVYQEKVYPDGSQLNLVTAKPPCKSFCVQVSDLRIFTAVLLVFTSLYYHIIRLLEYVHKTRHSFKPAIESNALPPRVRAHQVHLVS